MCAFVLFDKRDCWKTNIWYALYTLNHFTVSFLQAHLLYVRLSLIIDPFLLVCTLFSSQNIIRFVSACVGFLCFTRALLLSVSVLSRVFFCVIWNAAKHIVPLLDLDSSFDMCISAILFPDFPTRRHFLCTSYCVYFLVACSFAKGLCAINNVENVRMKW